MKKSIIFLISSLCFAFNEPYNYDPFGRYEQILSASEEEALIAKPEEIVVLAILQNRAFINGKWYKKGDHFSQYTLINISQKMVTLSSEDKTLKIKVGGNKKTHLIIKDKK